MKNLKKITLLFILLILAACSTEDINETNQEIPQLKSTRSIREPIIVTLNTSGRKQWEKDVTAYFNPVNSTYVALVPEGTNVSALLPKISIDANITYQPQGVQDFTEPVDYIIQIHGNIQKFKIEVKIGFTDYDILRAIYWANSGNTLGWKENLDDPNLGNWEGILTNSEGNIRSLYMYDANLKVLPSEIGELDDLEILNISINQIKIPEEIGKLSNLRKLDAILCKLKTLPTEIGQLTNLTHLHLFNNELTAVPTGVFQLTQLQSLSISYNNIYTLPDQIFNLSDLKSLDFRGLNLSDIPSKITQLTNLKTLSLSDNNFETIPKEILQLSQLDFLGLTSNNLNEIPVELSQLSQLRWLNLSRNNLTNIPKEIGQLSNLKYLDLSYNDLSSLPREIGQLNKLDNLRLSNNNLTIIDGSICNLELQGTTNIDILPGVLCQY